MQCLTILLLVCVMCNIGWSQYPPSNYDQQQQQKQLQQQIWKLKQQLSFLQQQLYFLQQQQPHGQHSQGQPNNIVLPNSTIDYDVEYIPTPQGYNFSYQQVDGRRHVENAFIPDADSSLDSKAKGHSAAGADSRSNMKSKNRKLSPGSLRALAG